MSFNTFVKVAEIEKVIDGYKLGEITKQECMLKLVLSSCREASTKSKCCQKSGASLIIECW